MNSIPPLVQLPLPFPSEETTKQCHKCGQVQPHSQFYKNKRSGKLESPCKECRAKFHAEYYRAHKAESFARVRGWQKKNPHKLAAYQRTSYHRAKAKGIKWRYGWRDSNRVLIRQRNATWHKAHPEYKRMSEAKRRARQSGSSGTITIAQWSALKAQHDYRCLCCGKREPEIKLTLDHVIPLSQGDSHDIANAQPLCIQCNCKKNTKTIDYR